MYLRRSRTKRDDPSLSDVVQLETCENYIRAQGWEFDRRHDVFKDRGKSAYSAKARRPEFDRLLRAVRRGSYDRVVVYRLDRLSRQWAQWGKLLENTDEHVQFHSASEGVNSATSIVVLSTLAGLAQQKSANTSQRVRATRAALLKQGRWPGGVRPFGYVPAPIDDEDPSKGKTLVLDPVGAPSCVRPSRTSSAAARASASSTNGTRTEY